VRLHVTGATGFLGSELLRLVPEASTERVEIRDAAALEALVGRVRPDVVVHTAYRQDGPDAWAITVDGAEHVARGGQTVVVPAGAAHRFENTGSRTLELTSIQPVAEMKTEWL
jgi:dTDP-4-dehydrorhamnose reductase